MQVQLITREYLYFSKLFVHRVGGDPEQIKKHPPPQKKKKKKKQQPAFPIAKTTFSIANILEVDNVNFAFCDHRLTTENFVLTIGNTILI